MENANKQHIINIFISSTFTDMESERDIIKNQLIPQLEEELSHHNLEIRIVDLRWGINTLDDYNSIHRNEKILKVCINEIDRCRPYFIGLVGSRFGWIPDPKDISRYLPNINIENCIEILNIDKASVTALELYYGLFSSKHDLHRSFICLRNPQCYQDITGFLEANYVEKEHTNNLQRMKDSIANVFQANNMQDHLISYNPVWKEDRFTDLRDFLPSLHATLLKVIENDLKLEQNSFRHWVDEEIHYQQMLVQRYVSQFVGRNNILSYLNDRITQNQNNHLFLYGESGQGKSALMCRFYELLHKERSSDVVLFFSSTATPKSRSMANMLETFSLQLADYMGSQYTPSDGEMYLSKSDYTNSSSWVSRCKVEGETDEEVLSNEQYLLSIFNKLIDNFYKQFKDRKIYLLIDAYDGFDKDSILTTLIWLHSLPVSSLISLLTKDCITLKKEFDTQNFILLPTFNREDAIVLIQSQCKANFKELHTSVLEALMKHGNENEYSYSSPLWLKLVTHSLFALDISDFQQIQQRLEADNEEKIAHYLIDLIENIPTTPGAAFLFFIQKASAYIGGDFAIDILRYVAGSYSGLRESDLESLMGDRWSSLDFAVLRRWFRPYFTTVGTEGQWQLTHQLLISTINAMHIEKPTQKELFEHILLLPEKDTLRIKSGMYHALRATDDIYPDFFHFYIYNCRQTLNIYYATVHLLHYIREYPDFVNRLCDKIADKLVHTENDSDLFQRCMEHLKEDSFFDAIKGSEYTQYQCSNRVVYDRVVNTLCTQLKDQGYNRVLERILLQIEAQMEADIKDKVVTNFFLPKLYSWLSGIYEKQYVTEKFQIYKEKKKKHFNKYIDNSELKSSSESLSKEYFEIINELPHARYCLEQDELYNFSNRLHEDKFFNTKWHQDWIDEWAQIAGTIYASIIIPQKENKRHSKKYLEKAIVAYNDFLEQHCKTNPMPISELTSLYEYKWRLVAIACFLEMAATKLLSANQEIALKMQIDSLEIYASLSWFLRTQSSISEFSIASQAAARLFETTEKFQEAFKYYVGAYNIALDLVKNYPNSEESQERVIYSSHALGRFMFNRCMFKEALPLIKQYQDGALKLYTNNPDNLQLLSSLIIALGEKGQCLMHLDKYEEAIKKFQEVREYFIIMYNKRQGNATEWMIFYFNAHYYIARCCMEMGDLKNARQLAQDLYNEMVKFGVPDDSEFEPMENVIELIEMINQTT